jgi:hypothetical protein
MRHVKYLGVGLLIAALFMAVEFVALNAVYRGATARLWVHVGLLVVGSYWLGRRVVR